MQYASTNVCRSDLAGLHALVQLEQICCQRPFGAHHRAGALVCSRKRSAKRLRVAIVRGLTDRTRLARVGALKAGALDRSVHGYAAQGDTVALGGGIAQLLHRGAAPGGHDGACFTEQGIGDGFPSSHVCQQH